MRKWKSKSEKISGNGKNQHSNKSEVEMDYIKTAMQDQRLNMEIGGKEKARKAKGNIENSGKREETFGIQVVEWHRYESKGEDRVDRTCQWPYSPHRDEIRSIH